MVGTNTVFDNTTQLTLYSGDPDNGGTIVNPTKIADVAYVSSTKVTFTLHTGLAAGTYYVRALTTNRKTMKASFTINQVAPIAPATVSCTVLSSTSIRVSWSSVQNATSYKLYRSSAFDGIYSYLGIQTGLLTADDTTAQSNTTYFYKVLAVNAIGDSPYSQYASTNTIPPAAPVVSNIANGATYAPITPAWTDVEGTTSAATFSKDGAAAQLYVKGTEITTAGLYVLTVTSTKTENNLQTSTSMTFTVSTTLSADIVVFSNTGIGTVTSLAQVNQNDLGIGTTVHNRTNDQVTVWCTTALYDDSNRVLKVVKTNTTIPARTSQAVNQTMAVPAVSQNYKIKTFIWQDDLTPVSLVRTLQSWYNRKNKCP